MTVDIQDRLAGLRIEILPETAAVQREAVLAELRSPSPIPPRRRSRMRLPVVVFAAVLVVALSAAGALAAESALPGDTLYRVKQATEWVRSWVDPTVPAEHRIDELESLIDRQAAREAMADQLTRAEEAVVEAGDAAGDSPLLDRLQHVRDRIPPADETRDTLDRDIPPPEHRDQREPDERPRGDREHSDDRGGDAFGDGRPDGRVDRNDEASSATAAARCRAALAEDEPDRVPLICRKLLSEHRVPMPPES